MTPIKTLIVDLLLTARLKCVDVVVEAEVLAQLPEQIRHQQRTVNDVRRAFRELERSGIAKRKSDGYILTKAI